MHHVGQHRLAWCAYTRAVREADRFSPDPKIRAAFVAFCETRQNTVPSGDPAQFESELNQGQEYQAAYQRYEAEQIAAGRPLDDRHFYDAFHAKHLPIATPVGDADFMEVSEPVWAMGPLLAGLFGLLGGHFLWSRKLTSATGATLPGLPR